MRAISLGLALLLLAGCGGGRRSDDASAAGAAGQAWDSAAAKAADSAPAAATADTGAKASPTATADTAGRTTATKAPSPGITSAKARSADSTAGRQSDRAQRQEETAEAMESHAEAARRRPTPRDTARLRAREKGAPPVPAPAAAQVAETTKTTASAGASDTTTADSAAASGAATGTGAAPAATASSGGLRDPYHSAPLDTVSADVYDGWKQFNLNCARCHGEDVLGTTIAPHLIVSLKPDGPINTKELFVQTVCAGRVPKGMPAWCALGMEMGTIDKIYQYVKGRSDACIGPGRPAVNPDLPADSRGRCKAAPGQAQPKQGGQGQG
jgi:Cytochrome C oxidase, cbb3-type, subunit III